MLEAWELGNKGLPLYIPPEKLALAPRNAYIIEGKLILVDSFIIIWPLWEPYLGPGPAS